MKHIAKKYILHLGHMYAPGEIITTADTEYLRKLVENASAEIVDDEGKPIEKTNAIEDGNVKKENAPTKESAAPEKNKPIGRKPR